MLVAKPLVSSGGMGSVRMYVCLYTHIHIRLLLVLVCKDLTPSVYNR